MGKSDLWAAGFLLLLSVAATVESWRLVLGEVGKPGADFSLLSGPGFSRHLLRTGGAVVFSWAAEKGSAPGFIDARALGKVAWVVFRVNSLCLRF